MMEGKMKSTYYLVLIAILLASCSSAPSPDAVQTAIAQTQIAQPANTLIPSPIATSTPEFTSTPTPIPLTDIDLESLLILPNDLPPGMSGGQIAATLPPAFSSPKPDSFINQPLADNNSLAGGVMVLLFNNEDDAKQAYKNLRAKAGEEISNIGDQASGDFLDSGDTHIVALNFIRCHAVAYIFGVDKSFDKEAAINYATRLDKRLTPLVCP